MEYTEEIDHKKKIIIMRTKGPIHPGDLGPVTTRYRAMARGLDYVCLLDVRESTSDISITDAYEWIEKFYDSLNPKIKFIPAAHVVNADLEKLFRFVETTFRNRGARVRMFRDYNAAIEWLDDIRRQSK